MFDLYHEADHTRPGRTLVIAEIGVNHDGDVQRAIELIHAAKNAGADAVKFQHFHVDRLLSNEAMLASYQAAAGSADSAMMLLEKLSLSFEQLQQVKDAATQAGLLFVVTPFSLGDVDELRSLRPDIVKVASPDAVNVPLLRAVMTLRRPVAVSTGTCEIDELDDVVTMLKHHRWGGALLQCVSSYPAADDGAAIGGMTAMQKTFGLPVGYSDHTASLTAGAIATAAGACVIEKHLTYDTAAAGPDHAASLNPDNFARYVAAVREATAMIGIVAKHCTDAEREVRTVSRQSVCVRRDVEAGEILTLGDLCIRRPGTGIPARAFDQLNGQRVTHSLKANDVLRWDDVEAVESPAVARTLAA